MPSLLSSSADGYTMSVDTALVPLGHGAERMASLWYIVNVEAAVIQDGRYLTIVRSERESHAAGVLSLPGGKVEHANNTPNVLEETLRRELLEEVGVQIKDEIAYIESNAFVADDGEPVINIVFLCRYKTGTPTAVDPNEVAAVRWLSAQEILTHPKAPVWMLQSIKLAERVRAERKW